MRVAVGLKAHSGWAALVVVGKRGSAFVVVDRRRIELVERQSAMQPYHAAKRGKPAAAREAVKRAIQAARRISTREVRAAVKRERERGNEVAGCTVLVGNPMANWSVEEILAVHFRMHKAEGMLFRDVLIRAAKACGLRLIAINEQQLTEHAERALGTPRNRLLRVTAALGKSVGPPWGKDQKEAALAAMIALRGRPK